MYQKCFLFSPNQLDFYKHAITNINRNTVFSKGFYQLWQFSQQLRITTFQYLVHIYFLFAEFFLFADIDVNIFFFHFSQQLHILYMLLLFDIGTNVCHGGLYCVTHFQIHRISTSCFPTKIGRRHMFSVEDPILSLFEKLA